MERIRGDVNEEESAFTSEEGEDVFQTLYMTGRFGCIPDRLLGDDLMQGIRSLYYYVLNGARSELQAIGVVWRARAAIIFRSSGSGFRR